MPESDFAGLGHCRCSTESSYKLVSMITHTKRSKLIPQLSKTYLMLQAYFPAFNLTNSTINWQTFSPFIICFPTNLLSSLRVI